MWIRLGLWARALGLLGLFVGCSSRPLEDAGPISIERACRDLQEAACAAFQSCSAENFGNRYPDKQRCIDSRTQDCVERRVAEGSAVTPNEVEACARATSSSTCQEILNNEFGVAAERNPTCQWQGTLSEGAGCITSSQCASGNCAFHERDACGACVARADLPCTQSSECNVGALCVSGQCVVAGALSAACGPAQPCSVELTCRAGQCAARARVDEPCGHGMGACSPELWCNQQTELCEHSTLLTAGGGCGVADSGSNFLCPAGSLCLPDATTGVGTCVPGGAEGAACSYSIECGIGLGCYEGSCGRLQASRCVAPDTLANPTYPAQLPSVPQCVAPAFAQVLSKPKAVLISFDGDASADTLQSYLLALGPSDYWRAATSEYGVGELATLEPIRVAEMPAAEVSDADLQAWLLDKIAHDARFPKTDSQTVYVLRYPAGVTITTPEPDSTSGHSCRDFGGYHSSALAPDGTSAPYAVIPTCSFGDSEATLAHELIEATTDPFFNPALGGANSGSGYATLDARHLAWALPAVGGAELADLCEWQPFSNYQDPALGGTVQRSWSNAAMAAFHQPCVPAHSTAAYFNGVPHFDDLVTLHIFGQSLRTRGIAIPLGQSKTVPVDLLSDAPTDGPWRVTAYDLKEWTNAFDYTAQAEPTLAFAFDRQSGVNGDTLQMTVTALQQDPDFQAEPFVVVSRRGRDSNVWLGLVGQP
jgi:hypothetical protein